MSNVRQYLPKAAKPSTESAPFVNAFLDGTDDIVAQLEAFVEYAQNQFFFSTADAEYVFKLAARDGFYLPKNSGLNIEGLKPLAPLMINQPKTTLALLAQILEIYFSQSLCRPSVICAQAEPYKLKANDDFIVKTREATHRLTIDEKLFSNIKNVSALELSTYINSVQDHYLATVYFDRGVNKNKIRLIPNGAGANEIIQILGGTLQNLLLFPDVVPTTNTTQTVWTVSKESDYTDIVKFQYTYGPLPNIFQVSVGDIVTFRNQFDVGASGTARLPITNELGDDIIDNNGDAVTVEVDLVEGNYSVLNGSFDVIEIGYDYFYIRSRFLKLPVNNQGLVIQLSSRDVIFTKNIAQRVYQQPNFSYLTEMTDDQLTVTVPAVPPIVKRFLEGSWHIYGVKHRIQSFTRTSVQVNPITSVQLPNNGNAFVLQSSKIVTDYSKRRFRVSTINSSTGIISLDSSDSYDVLPYTTPFLIGENPFRCDFNDTSVEINFPYRHGLFAGAKIIINSAAANPENGLVLNGSWRVDSILDQYRAVITTSQKNIAPPPSVTGILYSLGNKRYRITYSSNASLVLSKLNSVGKQFKLYDDGTSTINNNYIWEKLKTRIQTVDFVGTNSIEFQSLDNLSVLVGETIASAVKIQTSATQWGGNSSTYYFDRTDSENINLLNNLELIVADFIKPESLLLLGSYIYDPRGVYYKFLPSSIGTLATSQILKGESGVILSALNTVGFDAEGGYIIFDYGTANAEGPLKYLALSGDQIVIDPSYTFQKTHGINSTVRVVSQLSPFSPDENGKQYQPFATGTSLARNSFFEILKSVVSAGVFIQEDVLFPELRFVDDSLKPYE